MANLNIFRKAFVKVEEIRYYKCVHFRIIRNENPGELYTECPTENRTICYNSETAKITCLLYECDFAVKCR